jgi:drug/metabolite transporter (DMT)-like permease
MGLSALAAPFLAAMAFPLAALSLKRASAATRDLWGLAFACDVALGLIFVPFLFGAHGLPGGASWWQPPAAGAVFCLGQAAAFKSFQGELSIAIPMQGAKVLMVALLAWVALGQSPGLRFWGAAALSVAAIHFLNEPGPRSGGPRRILVTSLWAGLAAFAFAAFDVAVQAWSPAWGARAFAAYAFAAQALFSLVFLAFPPQRRAYPRSRRFGWSRSEWGWAALGIGVMASITISLTLAIGGSGQAAMVNLIFNSRCVAGVILVWVAGRWFGNREAESGRRVMARRLGGAVLMLVALGLALG